MKGNVRMLIRVDRDRAALVAHADIVRATRALAARGLPVSELPLSDALRMVLDDLDGETHARAA